MPSRSPNPSAQASLVSPLVPTHERPPSRGTSAWLSESGFGAVGLTRYADACLTIPLSHPDPLGELERVVNDEQSPGCAWAILLSYELGGSIEPKAASKFTHTRTQLPHPFPAIVIQRLDPTRAPICEPISTDSPHRSTFVLGALRSSMGPARYRAAVERVGQYIGAGDIYQANIAHHMECDFAGCPSACARVLMQAADARYGAVIRFEDMGQQHTICSLSPELFLSFDAKTRILRTEPMKGTRPIGADAHELEHSPKDRAELNMITDLMRNDIGRVCTLGSVRVLEPRKIESHADSVLQASSVVQGTLRDGVGLGELLAATFPPGSVTGAPKVRAMQIIDEIEQRPRNAYCGSVVHIDPLGNLTASVAIRTAHIWGEACPDGPGQIANGTLRYPVGAGIVADSDPESEWRETLVKSAILRSALADWLPGAGAGPA